MRVIFVRHSEPDYSMLDRCENPKKYSGFGRDLAPLTEHGRHLAREVARKEVFQSADVIISSSITRALETVTYIARETGLDLLVEPFFHEWRPDLDSLNYTGEAVAKAYRIFWENNGKLEENSCYRYETAEQVKQRFLAALEKYRRYDTVIIVPHGVLMRQFVSQKEIAYGEIITVDL